MNTVRLTVINPEEVLTAYGAAAVVQIQSASTEDGTYSNLGTVAIVAGTTAYTYNHEAGTSSTWYRSRYQAADGDPYSAWSDVWQGGVETGLCSLEDVRARVNPDDVDDTTKDAYLLALIATTTDLIHEMTGRYFLCDPPTGTRTYTFDGDQSMRCGLVLPIRRGIQSVTTLTIAEGGTGSTATTIDSSYYKIRPAAQDRQPGFPGEWLEMTDLSGYSFDVTGYDVISVTGVFGFADVPATIEDIALRTVVRAWRSRSAGELDVIGAVDGLRPVVSRAFGYDDRLLLEGRFRNWTRF